MQTLTLYDEIEIEESDRFSFETVGYDFPSGEDNLCIQAYRVFSSALGIDRPVAIRLRKRIPVFAGLGGGSSDAAAVLRGLNQLWGAPATAEELAAIGGAIGSDVPFFISAPEGSALCQGRGELVTPMEPVWDGGVVLVFTGLEISTGSVYKSIDDNLTNLKNFFNLRNYLIQNIPQRKGIGGLSNDFAEVVYGQHSELQDIALSLQDSGAVYSSITGSGSAVFGLFGSEDEAKRVCSTLPPFHFKFAASTPAPSHR